MTVRNLKLSVFLNKSKLILLTPKVKISALFCTKIFKKVYLETIEHSTNKKGEKAKKKRLVCLFAFWLQN